jgi:hypothetical protein
VKTTPLCAAKERGEAETPAAMRVAIFKSMYDRNNINVLARRCDDASRLLGHNGEDAMTMLAFHALSRVEELEAQVLAYVYGNVNPMFIVKP